MLSEFLSPGTFTPLTQLVNLGLGNNQLRRLEEGTIEATSSLALVDLGYNAITYVDPAAFSGVCVCVLYHSQFGGSFLHFF